jgi:hypothetical protein
MNDEITAARREKRRKVRLKRFFVFFIVLVIVLGSVIAANSVTKTTFADIGDFFVTSFKGGGGYPAELGTHIPIQIERMSMAYAVITKTELLTYSSRGSNLMTVNHGYLNPCIDCAGNRILLYNAGNRDISVYNRSGNIISFKTEYVIIDAKVAQDGTVAALTQSERYSCQLEVYKNGRYEKLLTWYGDTSAFPIGTYLNDRGSLVAVARVFAKGGSIYTKLAAIDTGNLNEIYEIEFEGMALNAYFDGDSIVVVTDCAAYQISRSGEIKQSYEFPEMPILSIAKDDSTNISIAFGDNHQPAVNKIIILSRTLSELCVIEQCGSVSDMYMSSNRLYVLGDRVVSEYDMNGKVRDRYEAPHETLAIIEFNGIIAILPDRAERLKTPIKEEEE